MKNKIKILTAAVLASIMIMPCSIYAAENENNIISDQSQTEGEEFKIELFTISVGWKESKGIITITGSGSIAPSDVNKYAYTTARSIVIEGGITAVAASAFYNTNWANVRTIEFPATGLKTIGNSAFSGIKKLQGDIEIPSSVTSIGSNAFGTNTLIDAYHFKSTTPPTLGENALSGKDNFAIYVPKGSINTYKAAAGWSAYADRLIEEGSVIPGDIPGDIPDDIPGDIPGDVNGNGVVDVGDASYVYTKAINDSYELSVDDSVADVDCNGIISVEDCSYIYTKAINDSYEMPVEKNRHNR